MTPRRSISRRTAWAVTTSGRAHASRSKARTVAVSESIAGTGRRFGGGRHQRLARVTCPYRLHPASRDRAWTARRLVPASGEGLGGVEGSPVGQTQCGAQDESGVGVALELCAGVGVEADGLA